MEAAVGPGAWERLWAPYRKVYLREQAGQEGECPFCVAPTLDDATGLIVARGEHLFVVMNKYPYNAGHLLICTYRHIAMLDEITEDELLELGRLTQRAMQVLRATTGALGFNIGLNQGAVAGAGIAGHLHQHIVPRWRNDSNFMPIIGGTKVLSDLVEDSRQIISEGWRAQFGG